METAPLRLLLIHSVACNTLHGTHASNFDAGRPSRFHLTVCGFCAVKTALHFPLLASRIMMSLLELYSSSPFLHMV